MKWTESQKNKNANERRNELKELIIGKFKIFHPFEVIDEVTVFTLDDGLLMDVFSMSDRDSEDGIIAMEYSENMQDFKNHVSEDGDSYFADDYETANELFNDMLEETRR